MTSSTMAHWLRITALAGLLMLVVAKPAAAQLVAFGQLVEDRTGYGEFLAAQLTERGVDARDPNWTIPLAVQIGCPTTGIGTAAGCLRAMHNETGMVLFVDGIVVGGARPQSLALVVWDARTAQMVNEILVPLRDGLIPRSDLDRTLETIRSAAIAAAPRAAAPAPAPAPPPVAPPPQVAPPAAPAAAVSRTAPAPAPTRDEGTADRLRIELRTRLVSRTLEQQFDDGSVAFDAPYYPGLEVALEVFPVAFFQRAHPAAGLGLTLRTGKHAVNTVSEVAARGELFEVQVPTRHDTSYYGAFYEWQVTPSLVIRPAVGWHAVEYALGYNPLYANSFYQGIELGGRLQWAIHPSTQLRAGVDLRPGVDMGSTIDVYGRRAEAFGFGVGGSILHRFVFGLYAEAEVRYDRYTSTITGGESDVDAVDGFQSFVITVGYAY